jgi:hypothetical protein
MRVLIRLIALSLLVVGLGSFATAQALTHQVVLTWLDPNNPSGTTYNVKRATGLCSGTPTFSAIATAIAVKTYTDATVTPGNYCYEVTATFSGVESTPSNTVNPLVPSFAPTSLTFTVSDLLFYPYPIERTIVQEDISIAD